jgi:hypothetical protein
MALPTPPHELMQRQLNGAVDFLRGRSVSVSVVDRTALIRTYRVSCRREAQLPHDVVRIATDMGFVPDAGAARG